MFSTDYRKIEMWQKRKNGDFSDCDFIIFI